MACGSRWMSGIVTRTCRLSCLLATFKTLRGRAPTARSCGPACTRRGCPRCRRTGDRSSRSRLSSRWAVVLATSSSISSKHFEVRMLILIDSNEPLVVLIRNVTSSRNRREPFYPCFHISHEGGPGVADAAVLTLLPAGAHLGRGGGQFKRHSFCPRISPRICPILLEF